MNKIVGLFCKRALKKRLYSAKETYYFEEPTKQEVMNRCNYSTAVMDGCNYITKN